MSLIASRTTPSIRSLVTDFWSAGFACDHDLVGGGKGLASRADRPRIDAGLGPLTEEQIDDLVRNPVADLVRIAFGNQLWR